MPKESPFLNLFVDEAKKVVPVGIIVEPKGCLLYELFLNEELAIAQREVKQPKRKNSAFQVDLLILEQTPSGVNLPRVAIEFKTSITSHDIITYSSKAGKHKTIYPWLRYGLIASDEPVIPEKFFTHNDHFDFFIAGEELLKGDKIKDLAKELIEDELLASKKLQLVTRRSKYAYFRKEIFLK